MVVDFTDKARRPPAGTNDQESSLIEALPAHGMHDKIDNRFFRKEKNKTHYGEDYEKHPAHKGQLEKKDKHAKSAKNADLISIQSVSKKDLVRIGRYMPLK
jgi:hypothetical protein